MLYFLSKEDADYILPCGSWNSAFSLTVFCDSTVDRYKII